MSEQLDLFGQSNTTAETSQLNLLDESPKGQLKCYRTALQEVKYLDVEGLFSGFDSLKAITFSYDVGFIAEIMGYFSTGDILIGADFLPRKDRELTKLLADALTEAQLAARSVGKHETLKNKVANGLLRLRASQAIMDHRKLYLLKAQDGRTRVIFTSANMSGAAFNGSHREAYSYDDTPLAYKKFSEDFKAAWAEGTELPEEVLSAEKKDDAMESNPIIKKVQETGTAMVLKLPQEPPEIKRQITTYVMEKDKLKEAANVVVRGLRLKEKNGLVAISPKDVKKMDMNLRQYRQAQKLKLEHIEKTYPKLTFDYGAEKMFLDGVEMKLRPSEDEVRQDIDELLEIFGNFNSFITDNHQRLQENHFKLLNAMFSSPFHAKLRCEAAVNGIPTSSLPLFLILNSAGANSGKSFMVKLVQKMMTGGDLPEFAPKDCGSDIIKGIQEEYKGTPVFIDEINGLYMKNREADIKTDTQCENNLREGQPMLIFASNDVADPHEAIRKRAIFILMEARLPSSIDKSAYDAQGTALKKRMGTALYREYVRRMLEKITALIDFMRDDQHRPDNWYPDIMEKSSQTLLEILQDYHYTCPPYMRVFTWNDDYSPNAKSISIDAMEKIQELYKHHKECFRLDKDSVIITLGSDKSSKNLCKSLAHVLPSEIQCRFTDSRDMVSVTMRRKELEKRMDFRFKKKFWGLFG